MKNEDGNSNVVVLYEKIYTDDLSIHVPKLFAKQNITNININRYWQNSVDGFYAFDCINYLMCIGGNVRVVIANNEGNETYKFNQYFLGEFDGKIVKIMPGTFFAINNLLLEPSVLISGCDGSNASFDRLSTKIFNWNSKRC